MKTLLRLVIIVAVVNLLIMPIYAVIPPGGGPMSSKTAPKGACGENYIELGVPIEDGKDAGGEPDNCILKSDDEQNPIYTYLRTIIRFLSAGVGLVIVTMIIISGVQYSASGGNSDGMQAAKKRLGNAVVALLLFLFMTAILNFLIPGGLFS